MNVLITGATGGIGKAVSEYLSQKGIHVFACDKNQSSFENSNIEFIYLDVTDKNSIQALYDKLNDNGIILDSIISIAGIFMIDSFIEGNFDEIDKIFAVNLMGVINLNKTLFPLLKKGGRIVITTSDVAPLDPMPFNGIYNVSKTALDSYAQALRQELNLLGYKVISVRPGAFDTALSRASLDKTLLLAKKTKLYKKQSVKFYKLVKTFMGKPSNAQKIAKVYHKALTKKHPKIIYKKHPNVLLRLLNILPKKTQCSIIKLLLK